jgi:hypothetical protein
MGTAKHRAYSFDIKPTIVMAPVNVNWTTTPQLTIEKARQRVRDTLHESNPKLTTLEKALRVSALRQKARHQVRQCDQRPA